MFQHNRGWEIGCTFNECGGVQNTPSLDILILVGLEENHLAQL